MNATTMNRIRSLFVFLLYFLPIFGAAFYLIRKDQGSTRLPEPSFVWQREYRAEGADSILDNVVPAINAPPEVIAEIMANWRQRRIEQRQSLKNSDKVKP